VNESSFRQEDITLPERGVKDGVVGWGCFVGETRSESFRRHEGGVGSVKAEKGRVIGVRDWCA